MVDTCNIYVVIGYVLASKYRHQVLNLLLAGTRTSRDLADELCVARWAITKVINELRNVDLVIADGRRYSITEMGMDVITRINNREVNLDG